MMSSSYVINLIHWKVICESETNLNEIFIDILKISFKKMRLNMASVASRPYCFGLNGLREYMTSTRPILLVSTRYRPVLACLEARLF